MTILKDTKDLTKDLFPPKLHGCSTWLNWKYKDDGAKSPINAQGGTRGYDNKTIWLSLDDAIKRANANDDVQVGISLKPDGLKIGDSYLWCFDFDGFVEHEGNGVDKEVGAFVQKLLTYTEISPSGTGFKMFFFF